MNTANIFVELVVIGSGAAVWLGLLLATIFGFPLRWPEDDPGLVVAIPLLSVAYVLGVLVDRVADGLVGWVARRRGFASTEEHAKARVIVYTKAPILRDLFEYSRSRLRICRGWVLNSAILLVTFDAFALTRITTHRATAVVVGTLGFLLAAVAAVYGWRSLLRQEQRRLEQQRKLVA